MLRVSPDGKMLWILTAAAATNVVLDVEQMKSQHVEAIGKGPVQSAFRPSGRRYAPLTHLEETFVLVLEQATGKAVQRIDVGGPQAIASFLPDGSLAYLTVTGRNEIVAVDMRELSVVARIPTGKEPMGLILLDPTAP
jgi:DNA-binding beta-propeller fold protein YncE